MLSINADYVKSTGNPKPYLRRIAEAGFSHVHWCFHWNTDFLYSDSEIAQIAKWLQEYGLQLNDLHASAGQEKFWLSFEEYKRLAGVELVKNRIDMTARLGGKAIVIHIPAEPKQAEENKLFWTQLHKSLDQIEPYAKTRQVRIAAENLEFSFETLEKLLPQYEPDYLGLCYDSGHANIGDDQMDRLEPLKERLIAIHLSDNNGASDQHKLPFTGAIDWPKLTGLIAQSAYDKCVTQEVMIHNTGFEDEPLFLEKAFEAGATLAKMIDEHKRWIVNSE